MGVSNSRIKVREIEEHVDRALRIKELEREVMSLKEDNNSLRRDLSRHVSLPKVSAPSEKKSVISAAQINAFIEKLMADPETNLSYVPDILERPMEQKTLMYIMNALAHTVDSADICFLGHQLIMKLQPVIVAEKTMTVPKQYSEYDDDEYENVIEIVKGKSELSYDANTIPL